MNNFKWWDTIKSLIYSMPPPPLYRAVLEDSLSNVIEMSRNPAFLNSREFLNITPLELAKFLDKKEMVAILSSAKKQRHINIRSKNSQKIQSVSPSEFTKMLGIHYLDSLKFENLNEFKDVKKNCPWLLKTSFFGEENSRLGILYHKNIAEGYIANTSIQWINDRLGYGLFANEDLPAYSLIGEYTGIVRRLHRFQRDHNAYCFHYPTRWWSLRYYMIDALNEGNELRFINHSDRPNLIPKCLVYNDILHLALFTNTFVDKNSQLTFNYGNDYWRKREKFANST